MLAIEVLSCPDPEFVGVWRLHKNEIYLGFPEGDIAPSIPGLPSFAFLVEVLPDMLQGHPHPELTHWLLNGKRATRPRRLHLGDVITVCDVELKIVEAAFDNPPSRKAILDEKLQGLIANGAPILPLIKLLKEKTQ